MRVGRGNLTVSFENHDHAYKRTRVLRANQAATNGTVYIGDGCWGRTPRAAAPDYYIDVVREKRCAPADAGLDVTLTEPRG
jgi:hypothetical protein